MLLDISNEHTFNVKIVGEKTKKTYEGSFTVKCILNVQEQIDVGLMLDQYNRGSRTVPEGTFRYNRALAEMDIRIVLDEKTGNQKAPSWWRDSDGGRKLLDKNVVLEVFLKTLDAEKVFDDRIEAAANEAEAVVEEQAKKPKDKK